MYSDMHVTVLLQVAPEVLTWSKGWKWVYSCWTSLDMACMWLWTCLEPDRSTEIGWKVQSEMVLHRGARKCYLRKERCQDWSSYFILSFQSNVYNYRCTTTTHTNQRMFAVCFIFWSLRVSDLFRHADTIRWHNYTTDCRITSSVIIELW